MDLSGSGWVQVTSYCHNSNECSVSIKCGNFLNIRVTISLSLMPLLRGVSCMVTRNDIIFSYSVARPQNLILFHKCDCITQGSFPENFGFLFFLTFLSVIQRQQKN